MVISVRRIVLFFCLFLCGGIVNGEEIPETFQLVTVKFDGVHSISKGKLAETLAARLPEKWKFWKPKPTLSRSDLEEDLLRIKQFYQQNGYYHTKAEYKADVVKPAGPVSKSEKTQSKDGALDHVAALFTITEGPPVHIDAIDIGFETPVDGIDEDAVPG